VVKFAKLDKLAIKKIVVKFVDELKSALAPKNIRLNLAESVVDMLAEKGYDPKMGARPLSRKIDELIRVPLSKKILFDKLTDCTVTADLINDAVDFRVDSIVQAGVDANGFIVA
jgi:ATP-dependent Clp protease ATP-binding subunit ClpA